MLSDSSSKVALFIALRGYPLGVGLVSIGPGAPCEVYLYLWQGRD